MPTDKEAQAAALKTRYGGLYRDYFERKHVVTPAVEFHAQAAWNAALTAAKTALNNVGDGLSESQSAILEAMKV